MADLIIKPEATSGNKLILKDQAGGAVLTTADSGATIANATLNSPTLVTPALGTVTSGNLSNTAIVRPAGTMVWLDTETLTSTAGWSSGTTSWSKTDDAGSNPRLDIDLAQATIDLYSAIFIEVNSTAAITAGGSFTFAEFRIVRDGSGVSGSARQLLVGYPSNSMGSWWGAIHLMGTDQSPPSSGGAKYEMQFRNHHGNAGYAGNIAPMGTETDITATITAWGII